MVVAVIILIVCVLGLVGFIAYEKTSQKTNQPNVVDTKTERTNINSNIDANELGRSLFTKYSIRDDYLDSYVSNDSLEYAIYSNSDSSYITMSNELRMYLAYQNISRFKIDVKGTSCDKDLSCIIESVILDSLKDSFTELFGKDKEFPLVNLKMIVVYVN